MKNNEKLIKIKINETNQRIDIYKKLNKIIMYRDKINNDINFKNNYYKYLFEYYPQDYNFELIEKTINNYLFDYPNNKKNEIEFKKIVNNDNLLFGIQRFVDYIYLFFN
jgi:hypothetical protein